MTEGFLILWVLCIGLCYFIGKDKDRNPDAVVCGLILGFIGVIIVIFMRTGDELAEKHRLQQERRMYESRSARRRRRFQQNAWLMISLGIIGVVAVLFVVLAVFTGEESPARPTSSSTDQYCATNEHAGVDPAWVAQYCRVNGH